MQKIVRRVAIALSLGVAAMVLWARRVESPSHRDRTASVIILQTDLPEGSSIEPMTVAVSQRPVGTRSPRLQATITPGKRAFSFRVNDVSGIAGFILANSRVDLLLVIGTGDKRLAKLFLENVRILAIGDAQPRPNERPATRSLVVTVEVTVEEAERLTTSTRQGQIQLLPRGNLRGGPVGRLTD
jgi:Flp pilus assembly protein CpaB